MTNPVITIAMPFFNSAATLELAIRSLLNQSCSDFELLLCDDGSDDRGRLWPLQDGADNTAASQPALDPLGSSKARPIAGRLCCSGHRTPFFANCSN